MSLLGRHHNLNFELINFKKFESLRWLTAQTRRPATHRRTLEADSEMSNWKKWKRIRAIKKFCFWGSDISVDQVAKRLLNNNDHDNTYRGDDSDYDNNNEDNLKAF